MYGDVDVNLRDLDGMYPLHLAIKVYTINLFAISTTDLCSFRIMISQVCGS